VKSKWTTAGSVKLIRDFFQSESDWVKLLKACAVHFDKKVEIDAFLGGGDSGRVLKVVPSQGKSKTLALKLLLVRNRR
jgi:hypothetical protein